MPRGKYRRHLERTRERGRNDLRGFFLREGRCCSNPGLRETPVLLAILPPPLPVPGGYIRVILHLRVPAKDATSGIFASVFRSSAGTFENFFLLAFYFFGFLASVLQRWCPLFREQSYVRVFLPGCRKEIRNYVSLSFSFVPAFSRIETDK